MDFLVNRLSIFQKMLVAPMISILFFTIFLLLIYLWQHAVHQELEAIRSKQGPIVRMLDENHALLEQIAIVFKDSVTAGEARWLERNAQLKNSMLLNFKTIRPLLEPSEYEKFNALITSFEHYFQLAGQLSRLMLQTQTTQETPEILKRQEQLIDNTGTAYQQVEETLLYFQEVHSKRFETGIQNTRNHIDNILIYGSGIILFALAAVLLITFLISFSTRKRLSSVSRSMQDIAEEKADFNQRLDESHSDEIGELIIYFNRFTQKLQEDYLLLQEAQQISQQAVETKNRFLANMSHEIRTPMNAIIGLSHLALKTKLTSAQRQYLETIHDSTESLLGIINDILDFSKIEAGKLTLEKIPFSLKEVIRDTVKIISLKTEEKSLELDVHTDDSIPQKILGDPLRLRQILINLAGNAVKFTEKGSVHISVHSTLQTEYATTLEFAIRDTGIGMDEAQLSSLFQEFSQADESTTRKFGGTGLGLTICKNLVDMMGGTIQVQSHPGKGSTFSFRILFEIDHSPEASSSPAHIDHFPGNAPEGTAVLLVEDNPVNRQVAVTILEDYGYRVDEAANGQIALEILKKEKYDCILMDIQMPVMDGYETTQTIRSSPLPMRHTPIIGLSAHALLTEKNKSLEAGMNEYLTKPFNPLLLHQTILRICHLQPITVQEDQQREEVEIPDITLPGVDTHAGLQRVLGNKPAYLRLLQTFKVDGHNNLATLQSLLENPAKNAQKISSIMHAVKGTSANIGAVSLSQQAYDFEKTFAAKQTPDPHRLTDFLQNFITLLNALDSLPSPSDTPSSNNGVLDARQMVKLFEQLLESLDTDISKALGLFNQLQPIAQNDQYKDDYHQLEQWVRAFEIDEAKKTAKALITKIKGGTHPHE